MLNFELKMRTIIDDEGNSFFLNENRIWISRGNIFDVSYGLFGEGPFIKSKVMEHPYYKGIKMAGIYDYFQEGEKIYIGKGNTSGGNTVSPCGKVSQRGVMDRPIDFRNTVMSELGLSKRILSPNGNGIRYAEMYEKEDLANFEVRIKIIGAGNSELLKAMVAKAEVDALNEYYGEHGRYPILNTRKEVLNSRHMDLLARPMQQMS